MGKSTVDGLFRDLGIPVQDADKVVHDLYAPQGAAVQPVEAIFPGVVVDGGINRAELGRYVIGNEENMKRLEGIVHPLVEAERAKFIENARQGAKPLVVLDIPLLYENGLESQVDAVAVVSAMDTRVQKERVMARPGMTEEKFEAILSRQMPDETKRSRANYVIPTNCGVEETARAVKELVNSIVS